MRDTAAAGCAFEHHGIADIASCDERWFDTLEQTAAGKQRRFVLQSKCPRGVLQAEVAHLRGRRSDEGNARRFALLSECRVLAQKTITRMNGLGARPQCGGNDRILAQVTFSRRRRTETYGFVGP